MSLITAQPEMAPFFPEGSFAHHEVSYKIYEALMDHNLEVPGIKVELAHYGTGKEHIVYLRSIEGENFMIEYDYSPERFKPPILANVHAAHLKAGPHEIRVEEHSEGQLYMLCYYDGEFTTSRAQEVRQELVLTLQGELRKINAEPTKGRRFTPEVPAPKPFIEGSYAFNGPFLTKCTDIAYGKYMQYHKALHTGQELGLDDKFQYAMKPTNSVMSRYLVPTNDIPKEAFEDFIWCVDAAHEEWRHRNGRLAYELGCTNLSQSTRYNVSIMPKYEDGIYVINYGAYTNAYADYYASIYPRTYLYDKEIAEIEAIRAKSIIPLAEYDGSWEHPVYVISREIDFDEIAEISPIPEKEDI